MNSEEKYHEYERQQQKELLEDISPINKIEVQRWLRLAVEI